MNLQSRDEGDGGMSAFPARHTLRDSHGMTLNVISGEPALLFPTVRRLFSFCVLQHNVAF